MIDFQPFDVGNWGVGTMWYGLGIEREYDSWAWDTAGDYLMYGHTGADYGSGCKGCGFNPKHNFSIAVLMTSQKGMNCSTVQTLQDGLYAQTSISQNIYKAIVQNLTNGSAPVGE